MPTGLELGILNLIDVSVVATLLWLAIRLMRRTRARAALLGLAALGGIYLVAQWLGLDLTAALFRGFFAVVVLMLIVIFQEDLRRYFEQLGAMLSRSGREAARSSDGDGDILVRAANRLATQRTGALIVVPGREPLDRHLEGGIVLGGKVSEPLLLSLFDASSPGHDGAVVLREGRVERFASHLPLSTDHAQLGPGGTRHAAALGLAERCDALCVVVSEERGTISVARDGRLRVLSRPEDLLTELYAHHAPRAEGGSGRREPPWLEPALAVLGALVLWMLIVPGSTLVTTTLAAPVVVENLPPDLRIEEIEPKSVEVSLTGRRRDLLFLSAKDVTVRVDAFLTKLGRRTFELDPDRVARPSGTDVARLEPDRVRIAVAAAPAEGSAPAAGSAP